MEIESRYLTLLPWRPFFPPLLLCPFYGRGGHDHFSKSKK
jgi:hypothetical protein